MPDERIHQFKKIIFWLIVVASVEPENPVTSDKRIVRNQRIVACSGRLHLFVIVKRCEVCFQLSCQRFAQEIFGNTNFVVDESIDEFIKDFLQ